jgi:uncharacterized repeat protein (TIGR01451 family)
MKLRQFVAGMAMSMTAFSGAVLAQTPAQQVSISTTALQEVVVNDQNGHEQKNLKPVEKTAPGQEIVFKNEVSNNSNKPASNIVVTNPVPEHMYFVDAYSKDAGTDLSYSADGGKTFGKAGVIQIMDATTHTSRAARPEEYTHVRWTLTHALAAGAKAEVGFKADVK